MIDYEREQALLEYARHGIDNPEDSAQTIADLCDWLIWLGRERDWLRSVIELFASASQGVGNE